MARPSISFDGLTDLEKLAWFEPDEYKGAIWKHVVELCHRSAVGILSWVICY